MNTILNGRWAKIYHAGIIEQQTVQYSNITCVLHIHTVLSEFNKQKKTHTQANCGLKNTSTQHIT